MSIKILKETSGALITGVIDSYLPGGGTAVSVLYAGIREYLEQKKQKVEKMVSDVITELEARMEGVINSRLDDQRFYTYCAKIAKDMIFEEVDDKIKYLKNFLVNVGYKTIRKDDTKLTQVYYRYIIELSVAHIMLLNYLNNVVITKHCSYPELYNLFNIKYLEDKMDHSLKEDEFMLLCKDLSSRNLVEFSEAMEDFNKVFHEHTRTIKIKESEASNPTIRITDVGREFINFIEDNAT